jgi:hypothetical protein
MENMNQIFTIGIIGVGQLGSRYLQGLAKTFLNIEIEVVEPQAAARKTAQERFEQIQVANPKKLTVLDSIDALSKKLDIVIVSTNSDVRASVIKELLGKKTVGALVLEKVLFQKIHDYQEIEGLLVKKNIRTWVNHPSRASQFYMQLKKIFRGSAHIDLNVIGGGWGMACNSLHFIDTFSFLTDNKELIISTENLSPQLIDAKRTGFKEVVGLLAGRLGENHFSIHCLESSSPLSIILCSENVAVRIDESNAVYEIAEKSKDWVWQRHQEKIVHFQSETTNLLIEDILLNGKCNLPTYRDAMDLHVPFITALLGHMNRYSSVRFESCPIT